MSFCLETSTYVTALRMAGCGHIVYLSHEHIKDRRQDHKSFWCSVCGRTNCYPGKSDIEKLRGQLSITQDMLDSARAERDRIEYRRRAAKGQLTKAKKRMANGVCPCCNRSFANVRQHMQRKHPDFLAEVE